MGRENGIARVDRSFVPQMLIMIMRLNSAPATKASAVLYLGTRRRIHILETAQR